MSQITTSPTRAGIGRAADWRLGAGLLLMVGLLAFEIFNFDTTQYALSNLMGNVSFAGLRWATVLAIAFCAIDFAGLLRIFKPDEPDSRETWYLMGAWLLAATMNAIMTWWAVTLTLLNHDLGNEVLGRTQLVNMVPIFIAVLVWLTRILFIGAFTVAGNNLFERVTEQPEARSARQSAVRRQRPSTPPLRANRPRPSTPPVRERQPAFSFADRDDPDSVAEMPTQVVTERPSAAPRRRSRIQRRPPMPGRRPVPMTAKGRNDRS